MSALNPRTLSYIATLDPKARQPFADFAAAANRLVAPMGVAYVMIAGNRTYAEQNRLYAQGRTAPGKIVTRAKGGQSNHNFGIAADFGVFRGHDYLDETEPKTATQVHKACAALAEEFGLSAGFYWESFRDEPHYEVATKLTTAQKRARFERTGSVL